MEYIVIENCSSASNSRTVTGYKLCEVAILFTGGEREKKIPLIRINLFFFNEINHISYTLFVWVRNLSITVIFAYLYSSNHNLIRILSIAVFGSIGWYDLEIIAKFWPATLNFSISKQYFIVRNTFYVWIYAFFKNVYLYYGNDHGQMYNYEYLN